MGERRSDGDSVVRRELRDFVDILKRSPASVSVRTVRRLKPRVLPCRSKRTSNLLYQHGARNTSPTHLSTFCPSNASIVPHNHHFHIQPTRLCLLNRHTEVENVAGVVHHDDQHALLGFHSLEDASPDLLCGRRRKDGSCDSAREQSLAHESGKRGFVSAASTRDDGDLWRAAWSAVDDLVLGIEGAGRVSQGYGLEGGKDEVGGIVDEVLG